MKPKEVRRMNIPEESIIEIVYRDSSTDNELVYFVGVKENKLGKEGIDGLICRLRPKLKPITRNLEAIENIHVYERR